ncbi:colicin transporter [Pseudomonas sp. D5002]|uniref:colicin-like pore-forming protein n=1 Tax=Pseudomonas sp. D5002 TaxID=2738818 RepID=UPI0015A2184A|nr:colicin-like pore-forming protein [Pseudomonas sp. D5002]NWB12337.1 colicin transporter [Pseudomonas sp. D5002]
MSTANGIELPPIIVTPDPLPPPLPPIPTPGGGYVAKPGTWIEGVGAVTKLSDLPVNVYSDTAVVTVVVTVASYQRRIEESYNAHVPNIASDLELEINQAIVQGADVSLNGLKAEKAVIDNILLSKKAELENDTLKANSFFGRGFLDKEFILNGVDFANSLKNHRDPDVYFDEFGASATAAYNSRALTEEIRILTEKANALSSRIATAQAEEDARLAAEAEAKRLAEEQAKAEEDMKGAIKFTADFYKDVSERFGAQMSSLSQELAEETKGKTLRNAQEALKAFDQYKENLNKKFSSADRKAILDALESLDKAELAKNLDIFGKAFGYVGKAIDTFDLLTEVKKGYETGDWNSTVLKVETLFAGAAATGLIAFAFGVTVSSPIGIVAFALIMALVSAFIDDARVKQFNDALDSVLP